MEMRIAGPVPKAFHPCTGNAGRCHVVVASGSGATHRVAATGDEERAA